MAPGPGCVSRRRSASRPSASGAPPRRSSPGAPPPPGASHASSAWPWSMFSRFISSRLLTRRASTARACGYCGRSLSRAPYGRRPPAGRSVHRRRQTSVVRTGRRALRRSPENPASAVPFVFLHILFRPHYHDVQFALQFVGAIQDSRVPRKEDVPSSQIVGMKVVPVPPVRRVGRTSRRRASAVRDGFADLLEPGAPERIRVRVPLALADHGSHEVDTQLRQLVYPIRERRSRHILANTAGYEFRHVGSFLALLSSCSFR